jgi:predicted metal-dependent peptidase
MLNNFDNVRAKLVVREGLFAYILYSLLVKETKDIPTACTNGKQLSINPDYWNKNTDYANMVVLLHEIMHIVCEHHWQFTKVPEEDRFHYLFNVVADIVINKILEESGYSVGKNLLRSFASIGMPQLDRFDVTKHTTLWFYEQVIKKRPNIKIFIRPDGLIEISINGRKIIVGKCVEKCSNQEVEKIRQMIELARTLYNQMSPPGTLSANMLTYLNTLYRTQTDWKSILKNYFQLLTDEEYTYSYPKQRGWILRPGLKALYEGGVNIILIIDSSGSISDETLHKFACELYTLISDISHQIYLIVNDTDIRLEKTINSTSDIPQEFSGRGGTMFAKAFERLTKPIPIEEPVVVVLTDGWIYDLEELPKIPYQTVWCIIGNDSFEAPFGHTVMIEY